MEEENIVVMGMGVAMLASFISSLFQDGESPSQPPPQADGVEITSTSWEEVGYPYTSVWGDDLVATFYRGEITITSDSHFSGRIVLSCPYTIAPVPLLSEQAYQDVLAELDELIAGSTGEVRQRWVNRRALALEFPQVDGFYIDYRWLSDWERMFREWIVQSTDFITWDGIDIPAGQGNITVGFFKTQGVGIAYPVTITLYDDAGNPVAVAEAELPGAWESPALLDLTLPQSVSSGADFQAQLSIRVPVVIPGHQETTVSIVIGQDFHKSLFSPPIAEQLNEYLGYDYAVPLDRPDDVYELAIDCKATYRYYQIGWHEAPLSPGLYPVHVKTETWRVDYANGGLNIYGNQPYESIGFYNVATINVT